MRSHLEGICSPRWPPYRWALALVKYISYPFYNYHYNVCTGGADECFGSAGQRACFTDCKVRELKHLWLLVLFGCCTVHSDCEVMDACSGFNLIWSLCTLIAHPLLSLCTETRWSCRRWRTLWRGRKGEVAIVHAIRTPNAYLTHGALLLGHTFPTVLGRTFPTVL